MQILFVWSGQSIIFLSLPISYKQTLSAFPILKCQTGAETHQHCTPQRGASAKVVSQYPEGNCSRCCLEHVPVFFPRVFFKHKTTPLYYNPYSYFGEGGAWCTWFLQGMKKYIRGILVLAAREWLPNWQLIHMVDQVRVHVVLTSEHVKTMENIPSMRISESASVPLCIKHKHTEGTYMTQHVLWVLINAESPTGFGRPST